MSRYHKQIRPERGEAARLLGERLARRELGDTAYEESLSHHDGRAFKRFGLLFILVFGAVVLGVVALGY